jgi:hypothetical protein
LRLSAVATNLGAVRTVIAPISDRAVTSAE